MDTSEDKRSRYPRVSDIIGIQTEREMRAIPIEHLVVAALRGRKIHAYCTTYVLGLALPEIELEYEPYVNSFIDWCDKNVARALMCTTRLYDDVKRFSGEPDMILQMSDGKKALVDLKTTATVSKSWDIQLAAYDHLCKANGLTYDEVFILHLKKKAAKKKKEEDQEDLPREVNAVRQSIDDLKGSWDIFDSALRCYDYFNRKEPKEKKS